MNRFIKKMALLIWMISAGIMDISFSQDTSKIMTDNCSITRSDTIDTYHITLKPGWNWVSFPRLERDPLQNQPVPADFVLNHRILPGPHVDYTGTMEYKRFIEGYSNNEEIISIRKPNNISSWIPLQGQLVDVYSPQGYQIDLNPDQQYIELYGEIQDPSVEVQLHRDFENWVGYFLPYPQHPVNAIPAEIRENLQVIAGQYWYCINEAPVRDGTGGIWRCVCSQGDVKVKYGDMIKLYSLADNVYNWEQNTPQPPGIDRPPSNLFSFEEQAGYEAYVLELDTNDLPDEIGAMVGDTCIGATIILPQDDTVLVCAYPEGFEGEEVSFQFAYSTKASTSVVSEYKVLNTHTRIMEKRTIIAGEAQPYYFISFRDNSVYPSHSELTDLICYPNPVFNELHLNYFIPKESEVSIHLSNAIGKEILSWNHGIQSAGKYDIIISTAGIPPGYYLLKLATDYSMITEKLCIVR